MQSKLAVARLHSRYVLFSAVLAVLACLWAGCSTGPQRAAAPDVKAQNAYVGAQACAECHREIFDKQSASHHALTLGPVTAAWAAGKFDPALRLRDRSNGNEYGVAERDGQYWQIVYKGGREAGAARIDYLLGSGHHGVSPMTYDGSQWRYLALTYYANRGWDFSPMHGLDDASARGKNDDGWPVSVAELQKCYGCHSTQLAFRGSAVDTERSELGVRCESCHGPGRAHVAAARAKSSELAINNPRKWSSESFMALCQQCHNETSTLEGTLMGIPEDPRSPTTVKYHVYGIEKSRCFTKSAGAFRCTTCHDPHQDSTPDPAFYEKRCRSCHQPGASGQTVCPVNSKDECLSCHMPKVQVEKHTFFADHWIRARSPFVEEMRKAAADSRHATPDQRAALRILGAAMGKTPSPSTTR